MGRGKIGSMMRVPPVDMFSPTSGLRFHTKTKKRIDALHSTTGFHIFVIVLIPKAW